MFSQAKILLVLVALVAGLAGCSSDDNPNRPGGADPLTTAVVRGELTRDTFAYEFASESPGGANDPAPGSFMVRVDSLVYDADTETLEFDMWVFNASRNSYPNPVSLMFMQLMPEGVSVLNADNDETGAGARFEFGFANDDLFWTPGESSFVRKVRMQVPSDSSIGFVAKVEVGEEEPEQGGTIGGMVWHDENGDGLMGADEAGAEGVVLMLHAGSGIESHSILMRAVTDADGYFGFESLDEGHYTVELMPARGLVPTTEPLTHVLLVAYDGDVADFLDADFGVMFRDTPDMVAVGDCLNVKGLYRDEPHRLETEVIAHCDCDDDPDCGDEDEDKSEDDDCWGRLSGPITALDRENGALQVMGTWVYFGDDDDWKAAIDEDEPGISVGMRVRVNASLERTADGPRVIACRIHSWQGNGDRVRGYVQEVLTNEDGDVTGVKVLNTLVTYPRKPRD